MNTTERVNTVLATWHALHLRCITEGVEEGDWEGREDYTYLDMLEAIEYAQTLSTDEVLAMDWQQEIVECNAESGGADDEWGVWLTREARRNGVDTSGFRTDYAGELFDIMCDSVERQAFS